MFNIPGKEKEEFYRLYEGHRMNISATNVYFQNIRLINTYKTEFITRDDFKEHYKGILDDVENTSPPIDCLIPNDQKLINEDSDDPNAEIEVPEGYKIFVVNQLVPEYKTIDARIRADKMEDVLPADHPARMAVLDNPDKMTQVIDEIFLHWLVFKYLETIEKLHIQTFSNYTPVIEWVVQNIDEKALKNYLMTKNINLAKVKKLTHEFIFNPDLSRMKKFYEEDHGDIKGFDVVDLIGRLTTNEVVKGDIYIITALYLTLSFAMTDIYNNQVEESPCAKYVRDILAHI
jgi:hypothetical protein